MKNMRKPCGFRHSRRHGALLALILTTVACGGVPQRAVESPVASAPGPDLDPPSDGLPPRPAPEELVHVADGDVTPLDLGAIRRAWKVKGVAAAPASCAGLVASRKASPPARPGATADGPGLRSLAVLADSLPTECADVAIDGELPESGPLAKPFASVVVAQSFAAKLARTAQGAPVLGDAADKPRVKAFVQGPLARWVVEQATAIEALSLGASNLVGYGRAIAATEAGVADLRLVDSIRSAPVPKAWDAELVAVYEAALDEALEPRKARGRTAALVGLAEFAQLGVSEDPRVARARALLTKLYGGRRVDALDGLFLPVARASAAAPSSKPLATNAYWAAVAPELGASRALEGCAARTRERLDLGRTYFRRVDFAEAAHLASEARKADPSCEEADLYLALALALARGPRDARAMMLARSPSELGVGDVHELDALAASRKPKVAGYAAYAAAHLRAMVVPEGEAAKHLTDLAERFRVASTLLEDPSQKQTADKRARESEAAAGAL